MAPKKDMSWITPELRNVAADPLSILEKQNPRSRGFLVSRINAAYGTKTRSSDEKISQKGKGTSKPKAAWKTRWEADPAYKAWKEAQVPKGTVISDEQKAKFADLQADAFRCRDKIRREEGLKTEAAAQIAGGSSADE